MYLSIIITCDHFHLHIRNNPFLPYHHVVVTTGEKLFQQWLDLYSFNQYTLHAAAIFCVHVLCSQLLGAEKQDDVRLRVGRGALHLY